MGSYYMPGAEQGLARIVHRQTKCLFPWSWEGINKQKML